MSKICQTIIFPKLSFIKPHESLDKNQDLIPNYSKPLILCQGSTDSCFKPKEIGGILTSQGNLSINSMIHAYLTFF